VSILITLKQQNGYNLFYKDPISFYKDVILIKKMHQSMKNFIAHR